MNSRGFGFFGVRNLARVPWVAKIVAVVILAVALNSPDALSAYATDPSDYVGEAFAAMDSVLVKKTTVDTCCGDCEDQNESLPLCRSDAACIATCGKLLLEFRLESNFFLFLESHRRAPMATVAGAGFTPSPLRRPPRQV